MVLHSQVWFCWPLQVRFCMIPSIPWLTRAVIPLVPHCLLSPLVHLIYPPIRQADTQTRYHGTDHWSWTRGHGENQQIQLLIGSSEEVESDKTFIQKKSFTFVPKILQFDPIFCVFYFQTATRKKLIAKFRGYFYIYIVNFSHIWRSCSK